MSDGRSALLETEQLSWGYPKCPLAAGLSLSLASGEVLAVIGPNGAGKSTLVRTLAGVAAPLFGSIALQGIKITELTPRDRARRVAVLPQNVSFEAGLTVRELVALGRTPYLGLWGRLSAADQTAVEEALARCEMDSFANRRVSALSGGERQRAYLAMVVAQRAPVALLDEPATHLDLRWRHVIYQLLRRLRQETGLAIVIVCHDIAEALSESERVLLVAQGHCSELSPKDPDIVARLAQAFSVPEERIPKRADPSPTESVGPTRDRQA